MDAIQSRLLRDDLAERLRPKTYDGHNVDAAEQAIAEIEHRGYSITPTTELTALRRACGLALVTAPDSLGDAIEDILGEELAEAVWWNEVSDLADRVRNGTYTAGGADVAS